ncbi:hypothetical protein ACJRO7_031226 [Eucalyptus globulus]|uniref:malate dehydrogenase n=1 Tax=Eucalyptus globulus TaxID=34317 RepID=A0ABD3JGP2_EUCGL
MMSAALATIARPSVCDFANQRLKLISICVFQSCALGGIGRPLAVLTKINPPVFVLHLYDVENTAGVTADISPVDTGAVLDIILEYLDRFMHQTNLLLLLSGPWISGTATSGGIVNINAGMVRTLCDGITEYCPKAIVNLISNPVNSTASVAAKAEVLGLDPREVDVPVVRGHAEVTILPLLSQVCSLRNTLLPPSIFVSQTLDCMPNHIRVSGAGLAILSMAYAAMKFADACLRRLRGYAGIVQCAFAASQVTDLLFFSSKVRLNRTWAEELLPLGPLNEYESSFNFGLCLLTCGPGLERAKKELAATRIVSG